MSTLAKIKVYLSKLQELRTRREILFERAVTFYRNSVEYWYHHPQKFSSKIELWEDGHTEIDLDIEETRVLIRAYALKTIESFWDYYARQKWLGKVVERESVFGELGYEWSIVDAMI